VIAAARRYLTALERKGEDLSPPGPQGELLFRAIEAPPPALPDTTVDLLAELAALDPDAMTPREALDALYRLKALRRGTAPA
jgi:DNA mismatch repair protein MutS